MELVTLTDLATELNVHRSYLRKWVLSMGIHPEMVRTEASRNQLTLAVSQEEAEDIRAARKGYTGAGPGNIANGKNGVFYLLVIDPEARPGRLKLGFAQSLEQRMRSHYTIAPKSRLPHGGSANGRGRRPSSRRWDASLERRTSGERCTTSRTWRRLSSGADTVFRLLPGYTRLA